jgi:NAD(P)-dependent dehydrogenase (short-subunit alcohol dehydrogenase family)
MNLKNKTIIIVGGATGIGRATAEVCAAAGATVIVADFKQVEGQATASAAGGQFLPINVTDEASVASVFAKVAEQHGKLDALIQTAGVFKGAFVPIEEFSLDMFRQVIDVNLSGSFLCAKYAAPLLKKAGKGVIVLVSSVAAVGGSSSYAYGSSKGGVNTLGITLANKLAADNIRVNVVLPGNIDTAMKRSVVDAERERFGPGGEQQSLILGEPIGVGKVLAWLASDDADYVRGMIHTR